jgi:2-oxo-3-hexenedioate decarboxylase
MAVDVDRWVDHLLGAVDERREVPAITKDVDELSIDDAYAIQAALLHRYLARGESIAGAKLGLTSAAKQEQMGVDEPVYGWVLESSVLPADAEVPVGALIHPRVEPELVFRLGEDLAGPGVSAGDVLDATAEIVGGIEVIDSRYEAFSFTLPDVIADNTSAARVAIGTDGIAPGEADLATLGCLFEVDGEITGTATGAALLGDPATGVAMLANHVGRNGEKLEAGWVIPAGAPTDARPLGIGTRARARYSHLGPVTVTGVA